LKIGIKVKIGSYINKKGESLYYLRITGKERVKYFFDFLKNADPIALDLAKSLLPWKFNKNTKFGDYKHLFS
jgi:hypothetical protein